jgi:hypothetical protein
MSLQHHFVVVVENGKLWIDLETTNHKFYEGSIWNTELNDSEASYEHLSENDKAYELLWNKLNKTWWVKIK